MRSLSDRAGDIVLKAEHTGNGAGATRREQKYLRQLVDVANTEDMGKKMDTK